MGKTKLSAIILVIISTLFISIAQIFYKLASQNLVFSTELIFNYSLWIGLFLYAIAALLLILALQRGELSTLYPMIALGYFLVVILSHFVFGETINTFKLAGIVLIIIGVGVLGAKS